MIWGLGQSPIPISIIIIYIKNKIYLYKFFYINGAILIKITIVLYLH